MLKKKRDKLWRDELVCRLNLLLIRFLDFLISSFCSVFYLGGLLWIHVRLWWHVP